MGERGVQVSWVLLKGASVLRLRLSQYPPMSFAVESASQFLAAKASQSRASVLGPLRLSLDPWAVNLETETRSRFFGSVPMGRH